MRQSGTYKQIAGIKYFTPYVLLPNRIPLNMVITAEKALPSVYKFISLYRIIGSCVRTWICEWLCYSTLFAARILKEREFTGVKELVTLI